jgi:hypothetical protein
VGAFLAYQMEGDVSEGSPIFGGMVLPDARAVFLAGDIQRPMALLLTIPMLPNHRDEGRGRPLQTRKREAVGTGDRRGLVGRPKRFYGNHRVQPRPFCQRWQGLQVGHGPDPSADQATVGVIKRVTEIPRLSPGQIVLDVLMKVLGDGGIGLFVIALQGQEIVASLGEELVRDSRWTSQCIDGDNTAFDGEQLEEFWSGRDLVGLAVRPGLANNETTLLSPGREHM